MIFIIKSDKETVIEWNSSESNVLTIPYGITHIEWLEIVEQEEQIEVYPEILEIPRTVRSIEGIDCDLLVSISSIHFNGTLAEWCSMDKQFLEQAWDTDVEYELVLQDENGNKYFADYLIIPSSVPEIKEYCFAGCASLKQVVIGSPVIEEAVFINCNNLEKVSIIGKELEIVGYWDYFFFAFPFNCPDISVTLSEEIAFYLLAQNEINVFLNMETWIDETGESLSEFIEQYEGITLEALKSKGIDTNLSLAEQFHKYAALEYDKEPDYGYIEDTMRENEDDEDYQEEVGFSVIDPNDFWEKKGLLFFNDYEEFDEYRW